LGESQIETGFGMVWFRSVSVWHKHGQAINYDHS